MSRKRIILTAYICAAMTLCTNYSAASVINAESDKPIVMGAGYDPAFGVIFDECVESRKSTKEKIESNKSDGAKGIFYNITLIENIEDLEKSLGLSASAKYGAASGKASFSSSIKMNSYNVYVLVEVKIKNQAETISRISLSDNALSLAKLSNERFRKVCGTEFVVSITKGGQLFGVMEINTNSKTQQQEIKASIKGNMGAFSASANANENLRKVVKDKSVKVTLWASGTRGGTPLPTDVETMLNFAKTFPKEAFEFPTSFLAITRPYNRVINYPEIDIFRVDDQRLILERIAKRRLEYIKTANDIDFVIKYPDQFEKHDASGLIEKRKALLSTIDTLSSAGSRCMESAKECKWVDDQIIQVDLPKRKDGVTMVCKPQRHANCGVESYLVKQSGACGYTLNAGTGEVCGVLHYNSYKGKVCGLGQINEEVYLWPHRVATELPRWLANGNGRGNTCPRLNVGDATSKCRLMGFDASTGKYGQPSIGKPCNNEFVSCGNYATCEHPSFGVKKYKTCQHTSFGKTAKTCAHESHGVAQYKMCSINLDSGERCD